MPLDGDKVLLIGLDVSCEQLFKELNEGKHGFEGELKEKDHRAYMVDTYNDEVKRIIYDKVRKDELVTREQWQQFADGGINDYVRSDNLPLWKEFMAASKENPKNQWTNSFSGAIQAGNIEIEGIQRDKSGNKIGTEGIELYYMDKHGDRIFLKELDENGGKIGIDMLKCYPTIKAYITLDGIQMKDIANRRYLRMYPMGQLRKMLRYAYRSWPIIKDQVTFMSKSRLIPPPWHEGEFVKDWQVYIENRENKVSKGMEVSSFLAGIHMSEQKKMCTNGTQVLRKMTIGLAKRADELNEQKKRESSRLKIQRASTESER